MDGALGTHTQGLQVYVFHFLRLAYIFQNEEKKLTE